MLHETPFCIDQAKASLKDMDLEKILTLFRKSWKKIDLDMDGFSLVPETSKGHHPKLSAIYNDGDYTLRLFYKNLPIASLGAVYADDFLGILQIQGAPCDDFGYFSELFNKGEDEKMRNILQSFYWSYALLTVSTKHFFDMGADELRVVSFRHNPNAFRRRNALTNDHEVNQAYITYDLTALTLGFKPMLKLENVSDSISVKGLSFDITGCPDKNVRFYGMTKKDYADSAVHHLVNNDIQEIMPLIKDIHRTLGNYRQKKLFFDIDMRVY